MAEKRFVEKLDAPSEYGFDWGIYRTVELIRAKKMENDFKIGAVKGGAGDYLAVNRNGDFFVLSDEDLNSQYVPVARAKMDTGQFGVF